MKKVISLIMIITLVAIFAGCGASVKNNAESTTSVAETKADIEETTTENETTTDNKTLVVYFSRTGEQYGVGVIEKGNTAIVADMIAEQIGADSFEILPKEDNYPITYDELTDYAKDEQNNNARPAIKDEVEIDSYDTVFIGYPIWWGDMPMICYTFLESYDFSGKTVIPFCTHAGSGNAGTQSTIQSVIPDAEVKEVLAITGTDAQNIQGSVKSEVAEWLETLGFNG